METETFNNSELPTLANTSTRIFISTTTLTIHLLIARFLMPADLVDAASPNVAGGSPVYSYRRNHRRCSAARWNLAALDDAATIREHGLADHHSHALIRPSTNTADSPSSPREGALVSQ